ncbi:MULTISPECIES: tyrosine-type recombinase/integrase [unclassified Microcoleus]|uniref:tyrosine-type recombinase/integrase n=1 Tax=unclassified Microcoleus TaxID=2642155 RepID=UPI002FD42875
MKAQSQKAQSACDVSVYSDKGSLALRFPKRHSTLWELLDGKSLKGKPKCLGIGKYGYSDTPEDWKRASQIAAAMEADLDHPEWEKLFDPTLAKYGLGGGKYAKLADVLQLPGTTQTVPEITVGAMWEAYLLWKKTTIEETTFDTTYKKYGNIIYGKIFQNKGSQLTLSDNPLATVHLNDKQGIETALDSITSKLKTLSLRALNQAFEYAQSKGLIVNSATNNPFATNKFSVPVVTTQQKYADKVVNGEIVEWHEVEDEKALENDKRAFTKDERDIIIKAFYESDSNRTRKGSIMFAPFIEFLFLTGCRPSEVYALTWRDVNFERHVIKISKSLGASTRKVKNTKTGESRLFYFEDFERLKALLLEIKGDKTEGLIFSNANGGYIDTSSLGRVWRDYVKKQTLKSGEEVTYFYPGIVSQLAREGKISGYLASYHCRHTYITLTAQANSHNNNALLRIASSCGNSVDVILRHYLGINESTELVVV